MLCLGPLIHLFDARDAKVMPTDVVHIDTPDDARDAEVGRTAAIHLTLLEMQSNVLKELTNYVDHDKNAM